MRNVESRLAMLPQAKVLRSRFEMTPFRHLTTMNAGKLVPVFVEECLPGANYNLDVSELVRMSTPIHPVMDDCYLDTYFFFVPMRLVWENWEEFMGENKTSYWDKSMPTYTIPQLVIGSTPVEKGSIADYIGIPTDVSNLSVNALPFRAYALIWNEWFRDENNIPPLDIDISSSDVTYSSIENGYFQTCARGGALAPVVKFRDYFTTSLPEPQRGADVMLPIGEYAPVITMNGIESTPSGYALKWVNTSGNSSFAENPIPVISNTGNTVAGLNPGDVTATSIGLTPSNLFADLSNATAATINELRMAIALQSFYEASARYGSRYTELLRGHFGVTSPDARLQRPEYLGGKRTKINMQQVLQTSATNDVSPQGNTAAFSLTADYDKSFRYATVEHGYIIGVCCIRTKQTYQYGIERLWSRKDMTDFYFPEFAHIGEQPVLNKEIYAQGTDEDEEVFGYQEAWAEYRQKSSRISGAYRSNYAQTLDSWHYAEKLTSLPVLGEQFVIQSGTVIDRTLAVTSEVEDQFLCDFTFNMTCVLPLPMYSIPGFSNTF